MSPKCPKCGYEPPRGRPQLLDDAKVLAAYRKLKSLAKVAAKFGVSRGAIQKSLKRTSEDNSGGRS